MLSVVSDFTSVSACLTNFTCSGLLVVVLECKNIIESLTVDT